MDISLKKQMSRIALIYVAAEAVTTVIQTIVVKIVFDMEGIDYVLVDLILSFLPLYTVGITAVYFLFKRLSSFEDNKEKKSLAAADFFKCLAAAFAAAYIFAYLNSFIMSLTEYFLQSPVMDPLEDFIESDSTQILFFLLGGFVAPIGEEVLFRYFPYKKLIGFGTGPYIIFTALMFSLFHMNFSQLLYTFAVGLVFGYIYSVTGKLRYTVAIHIFLNCFSSIEEFIAGYDQNAALILSGAEIAVIFIGAVILLCHLKTDTFKNNFTLKTGMNLGTWILNPGILVLAAIALYRSLLYF